MSQIEPENPPVESTPEGDTPPAAAEDAGIDWSQILDDWLEDGVTFPLLPDLAREALAHHDAIPARPLSRIELPGRGGTVATGWPETGS